MPLNNYQYTADSGTVYQVTLPTDFADALGMSPASGSEQYLDAAISPRYCNFFASSGGSRSAIIATETIFGSIPIPLVVGGTNYYVRTWSAESIPPYSGPLLLAPQGPQGAPGPQGETGPGLSFVRWTGGSVDIPTGTFAFAVGGFGPQTFNLPVSPPNGTQLNFLAFEPGVDQGFISTVSADQFYAAGNPPTFISNADVPYFPGAGLCRLTYVNTNGFGNYWLVENFCES